MPRTRLFDAIRRAAHVAARAARDDVPPGALLDGVRDHAARHHLTRRALLRGAGAAAAVAVTAPLAACGGAAPSRVDTLARSRRPTSARIAVVGAGLGGLACARKLVRHGVHATVLEASTRVGGRVLSSRGRWADGQVAELGAELVDSGHHTIHRIARELGLALDDLHFDDASLAHPETLHFEGRARSERELVEAFTPLAARMGAAMSAAEADPAALARLDATPMSAWLDAQPDAAPWLRTLLCTAYVGEYGLDADRQSALNLLYLVDWHTPDPFRIYGPSDERFHIRGGNDALATGLASILSARIDHGARLMRITNAPSGAIRLTVTRDRRTDELDYDWVVLALPFTMLRDVEVNVPLSVDKRRAIAELGYGTNAKIMSQYTERVWRTQRSASGSTFTDLPPQALWETSRAQPGTHGILTTFLGGEAGRNAGRGSAEERMRDFMPAIESIFPGTAAAYLPDSAVRMAWADAPLVRASYSCYLPGQWALYPAIARREGRILFAGEHCSEDEQGMMEGAAATGEAAAATILAELGVRATAA